MEERDDESPIKSVRKAIDILDVLSDARRPLRVGEIATVKIERADAYDLYGTAVGY